MSNIDDRLETICAWIRSLRMPRSGGIVQEIEGIIKELKELIEQARQDERERIQREALERLADGFQVPLSTVGNSELYSEDFKERAAQIMAERIFQLLRDEQGTKGATRSDFARKRK